MLNYQMVTTITLLPDCLSDWLPGSHFFQIHWFFACGFSCQHTRGRSVAISTNFNRVSQFMCGSSCPSWGQPRPNSPWAVYLGSTIHLINQALLIRYVHYWSFPEKPMMIMRILILRSLFAISRWQSPLTFALEWQQDTVGCKQWATKAFSKL